MEKLITRDHSLYWMGVATIAILLFHIGQNESTHVVHKCINFLFSTGSFGVNIFFFLSGYGLSYSYSKNSLKEFYFHRFKRLYPMMFVFMAVSYFINGGFSSLFLIDILKHATGLSFIFGSVFPDWFIPCLSFIYITFPLLFHFVHWLYNKNIVFVIFILVIPVLAIIPLTSFNYTLFFPRIPMVLLGIMTYFAEKEGTKDRLFLILLYCFFLSCTQLYKGAHFNIPAIILLFSIYKICPFSRFLTFLGKHSLEIYLAQCLFVFKFDFTQHYYITLLLTVTTITIVSICLYFSQQIAWSNRLFRKNKEQ